MLSRAMVIVVPGRTDRAFYKAFFLKGLKLLGFEVADLDSRGFERERKVLLRCLFSLRNERLRPRRAAVVKVTRRSAVLQIAILDAERRVVEVAEAVLKYHAGLIEQQLHALVVVEDAEEADLVAKVEGLFTSLYNRSRGAYDLGELVRKGRTFRLYRARRPGIHLLLMAQGVPDLGVAGLPPLKHAVEEYVLYARRGELGELLKRCKISLERDAHKKLALLLALNACYAELESYIYRLLSDRTAFQELLNGCEALRALYDLTETLLSSDLT